jgi:4'-phosphopantetheinyl transferase
MASKIPPTLYRTLSQTERQHYAQFHFQADKIRYLVGRAGLRHLLGGYLHQMPQDIVFAETDKGKPYLPHTDLQFNLSHAHQCIVYAFAREHAVGIDIEYHQPSRDFLSIAKHYFTPAEYHTLLMTPQAQQSNLFYFYWTRKEALLKAWGLGLSALPHLDAVIHPAGQVIEMSVAENYHALAVVLGAVHKIFQWEFVFPS